MSKPSIRHCDVEAIATRTSVDRTDAARPPRGRSTSGRRARAKFGLKSIAASVLLAASGADGAEPYFLVADSYADFSYTQQGPKWRYGTSRWQSGYARYLWQGLMEQHHSNGAWTVNNSFHGNLNPLRIDRDFSHPTVTSSFRYSSDRLWVSNVTGTVRLRATFTDGDSVASDGQYLELRNWIGTSYTAIWNFPVGRNFGTVQAGTDNGSGIVGLDVSVQAGREISSSIEPQATSQGDSVYDRLEVFYRPEERNPLGSLYANGSSVSTTVNEGTSVSFSGDMRLGYSGHHAYTAGRLELRPHEGVAVVATANVPGNDYAAASFSFTYANNGTYLPSLSTSPDTTTRMTQWSASPNVALPVVRNGNALYVNVLNVPPTVVTHVATLTADPLVPGATLNLSATTSDAGTLDAHSFSWDADADPAGLFETGGTPGPGTTPRAGTATFAVADLIDGGLRTIRVRVFDGDDATIATTTVHVPRQFFVLGGRSVSRPTQTVSRDGYVRDAGSAFTASDELLVRADAPAQQATMLVSASGALDAPGLTRVGSSTGSGLLTVAGTGSRFGSASSSATAQLWLGAETGAGVTITPTVVVSAGATAHLGRVTVGAAGGRGRIDVTGDALLGPATVHARAIDLAADGTGRGELVVAGPGARLTVDGLIDVGGASGTLLSLGAGGTIRAGTLDLHGQASRLAWTGGTLAIANAAGVGALTVPSGATLAAGGNAVGSIAASGTLSPGAGADADSPHAAGTLRVAGAVSTASGSTLLMHVNGAAADRLDVAGVATLAGGLRFARVAGGSLPEPGDTFTLLSASSLTVPAGYADGSLVVNDTGLPGLTFAVTSTATTLKVTLAGVVPGDANLTGTVTFDDLLAIAPNYDNAADGGPKSPTSGAGLRWTQGDFDGDGRVTNVDLALTRQAYDASAGPTGTFAGDWSLARAAAVPEPATAAGVLSFVAACTSRGRRRGQRDQRPTTDMAPDARRCVAQSNFRSTTTTPEVLK